MQEAKRTNYQKELWKEFSVEKRISKRIHLNSDITEESLPPNYLFKTKTCNYKLRLGDPGASFFEMNYNPVLEIWKSSLTKRHV